MGNVPSIHFQLKPGHHIPDLKNDAVNPDVKNTETSSSTSRIQTLFKGVSNIPEIFHVRDFAKRVRSTVTESKIAKFFRTISDGIIRVTTGKPVSKVETKAETPEKKALLDFILDPKNYVVTPKTILGYMLQDGNGADDNLSVNDKDNVLAVYNHFKENPDDPTFSSKNVTLCGDELRFTCALETKEKKKIESVKIDIRDCCNGEFRGKIAQHIFGNKDFVYSSLNDAAASISLDPERNTTMLNTSITLAKILNTNKSFENIESKYINDFARLVYREGEAYKSVYAYNEQDGSFSRVKSVQEAAATLKPPVKPKPEGVTVTTPPQVAKIMKEKANIG